MAGHWWERHGRVGPVSEDHHHEEEIEDLREEVAHLSRRVQSLVRLVEADFDYLFSLIVQHPHSRPARSATLVGHPRASDERNIDMAEIDVTGETVAVVALGADGNPTTDDINGPTLAIDDPSGVFVFTADPSGLSSSVVPNPGVFGVATITFTATDVNGNPLLDPSTNAAPVYEATVTAPPNPAVSATLQGTPLAAP